MKPSLASLPVSVLVLLALPLGAQGSPAPAPAVDLEAELSDILATDQIGAASKHVQDVASAPADVVVLRSSELKALGYRTLGDALGGVLGFRTNEDHAYQGLGSAGAYALGDQNTRILVLLDGHALNSPAEVGSSKVGEDFGLPLELVDHIEVVRGPASSLYGNNAYQALVNVVSMSAAGNHQKPLQAALTAGSGGLSELWGQGAFTLGGVTTTLMLSGFQRTGTSQLYPERQPDALPASLDREERQSAYLYVKGHQWSFAGALISRTQLLASAPYQALAGDPANSYRNRRQSGEFKWEPVTGSVHWMVRLFGDRNEFDDAFVQSVDGENQAQVDTDPDRSLGGEFQGRANLGDSFILTFGTEQQWHHYNGLYTAAGQGIGTDVSYTLGNTYLEGNWQPSARWNVVAGLQRADWRPSSVRNVSDGVPQDLDRVDISRLTPRLSVIWTASPRDVLKFIFGQGFRLPTIYEEYYTDGANQFANTSLKPEVLTSEQLSWARKWTPSLTSTASVQVSSSEHSITTVPFGTGQQFQNASDPVKGRAVQGEMAWHRGGTELSGGAGWYDFSYQGATLADSTRWMGVLKAIQRAGDWSLAGEARYVGARSNGSASAPATVPANWTLRSSLRREWGWGWGQVSLEDLTNSRRRDLVGPEYSPITWMESDGRAVRATLGVRF